LHVLRGVVGGEHDLLDKVGEGVEVAGGRAGAVGGGGWIGIFSGQSGVDCEFVKADGGCLAEVHGGLLGVGGDFDEVVTVGEVFASEAVFLWAKDEGNGSGVFEFAGDDGCDFVEADDGLFGFAVSECTGAENKGGVANGFGEC